MKIPFLTPKPEPPDPVMEELRFQNRLLSELLLRSGVALPPRSTPPSGPLKKRTEADVIVVGRARRVEIQVQEEVKRLPEYMTNPKPPIDPAQLSSAGTKVVGGFSAMTGTSPATATSPTSTPSPDPVPSTERK